MTVSRVNPSTAKAGSQNGAILAHVDSSGKKRGHREGHFHRNECAKGENVRAGTRLVGM